MRMQSVNSFAPHTLPPFGAGPHPLPPLPPPPNPPHRERGTRLERSCWSPSSPGEGGGEGAGEEGRGDEGLGWGLPYCTATRLRPLRLESSRASSAAWKRSWGAV